MNGMNTPPRSFAEQGFVVVGGINPSVQAIVTLAIERGAHVVLAGYPGTEASGERILSDARAAGAGERVFYTAADLSCEEEADRVLARATECLPDIRVLVSVFTNPVQAVAKLLAGLSLGDWNRQLIGELRGTFLISQRVLQEFLGGGKGGRIIYLVSIPRPAAAGQAIPLTARFALNSLCRSITKEYGRREITCNVVVAQEHLTKDSSQSMAIAETVLFLASDEASFVNGETVLAAGDALAKYHPSIGGTHDVER